MSVSASAAFPEDIKEQVRSRTDIVSLIGETVALRSKGRELVGLCPFHEDHNPSMHVYPDRQSYRCWVCNEGGDCFNFVMARERVSFREALEMLATRANIELPHRLQPQYAGGSNTSSDKQRLYEVLNWAQQEFHDCLLRAPFAEIARDYLRQRGFTPETIARYKLGFHPDNWEWLISRAGRRFTPEQLHAVRLVGKRDNGGYYDNFVNRVMFPIRDAQSRTVAFGGRILPGTAAADAPKYWNSPENPVFNKSRILFGLGEARDAIVKSDTVIVMEGYTDCIMAHQSGVLNCVGTLGTALTETHVTALKRFARKVVLVYDGDAAGQMASERALPKFLAQEVDLRILTLPADLDPADFLLQQGGAAFQDLLQTAEEAWIKKLQITVARYGLESIDARYRVLQEMLSVIAQVPAQGPGLAGNWQLRENIILGGLARRLGLREELIREQLADLRRKQPAPAANSPLSRDVKTEELFPAKPNPDEQLEREIVQHIFASAAAVNTIRETLTAAEFSHPHLRRLLEVCFDLSAQGVVPSYDQIMATLEDRDLKRLAAQIDDHSRQVELKPELLAVTLKAFQQRGELRRLAATQPDGPQDRTVPEENGLDAKARLRLAMERHKKRISTTY